MPWKRSAESRHTTDAGTPLAAIIRAWCSVIRRFAITRYRPGPTRSRAPVLTSRVSVLVCMPRSATSRARRIGRVLASFSSRFPASRRRGVLSTVIDMCTHNTASCGDVLQTSYSRRPPRISAASTVGCEPPQPTSRGPYSLTQSCIWPFPFAGQNPPSTSTQLRAALVAPTVGHQRSEGTFTGALSLSGPDTRRAARPLGTRNHLQRDCRRHCQGLHSGNCWRDRRVWRGELLISFLRCEEDAFGTELFEELRVGAPVHHRPFDLGEIQLAKERLSSIRSRRTCGSVVTS